MKPYRGIFLTSAVLFAALSLSSCGDADKWKTTDDVVLTANSTTVGFKDEVIFTVRASIGTQPPATDVASPYQCETDLEYRAEGAGLDAYWHTVPGAGPTRVFVLEPRKVEPFAVVARGRCMDAKEDWKYSAQVDVTVTPPPEPVLPKVTSLTLTALTPSPYTKGGSGVTYSLSAVKGTGCTLVTTRQHAGSVTSVQNFGPTINDVGTFTVADAIITAPVAPAEGTLVISATAWCSENPTDIITATSLSITTKQP